MIMLYLIAFSCPLLYALSNILDSQVSNKIFRTNSSVIFYLGITNFFILPLLFVFGGWDTLQFEMRQIPLLFVVAGLDVFYQVPYFSALKVLDASIVSAMFSFGRIFLPLLAYVFLGEQLSITQYIGFFIIVISGVVLNLKKQDKLVIGSGFYLMILASLMVVFNNIFSKQMLNDMTWYSFAFYSCIMTDVIICGALFLPKFRKDVWHDFASFRKNLSLLLGMEVIDRTASLAGIYSLSLMPVVVRSAIGAVQPIFVVLWSVFLFYCFGKVIKENLDKDQIVKKFFALLQ